MERSTVELPINVYLFYLIEVIGQGIVVDHFTKSLALNFGVLCITLPITFLLLSHLVKKESSV